MEDHISETWQTDYIVKFGAGLKGKLSDREGFGSTVEWKEIMNHVDAKISDGSDNDRTTLTH
jgi:hypothetical protein